MTATGGPVDPLRSRKEYPLISSLYMRVCRSENNLASPKLGTAPARVSFGAGARLPRRRVGATSRSVCRTSGLAALVRTLAKQAVLRAAILRAANVRNKLMLTKVKPWEAKQHGECGRGQALGAV